MKPNAEFASTTSKMALLGSLYFSQGLPFGFFAQALPVLFRKQRFSLGEIGLTARSPDSSGAEVAQCLTSR